MTIEYITVLLENKLSNLFTLKTMASGNGDIDTIIRLDTEIAETQESIRLLKSIN